MWTDHQLHATPVVARTRPSGRHMFLEALEVEAEGRCLIFHVLMFHTLGSVVLVHSPKTIIDTTNVRFTKAVKSQARY